MQIVDNNDGAALPEAARWEVTLGRILTLHHSGRDSEAAAVMDEAKTNLTVQMGPAGM